MEFFPYDFSFLIKVALREIFVMDINLYIFFKIKFLNIYSATKINISHHS